MADTLTVTTERVDDIPVLLAQQVRMGVPDLLDRHFAPHGNRQGISLGALATLWLTHMLSEADHRMSHVRGWAKQRLATLSPGFQFAGVAIWCLSAVCSASMMRRISCMFRPRLMG